MGLVAGAIGLRLVLQKRAPDAAFFRETVIWLVLLLSIFGWTWFRPHHAASPKEALLASSLALVGAATGVAFWCFGWWTQTVSAPSMVAAMLLVALAGAWDPVLADRRNRRKNPPPARAFEVIQPVRRDGSLASPTKDSHRG